MVLRAIALIKIAKGLALAGIALGLFRLIHRDLDAIVWQFIDALRISPENHYARILLVKAGLIQPGTLLRIGIGSSIYALILLAEGFGLWFGAWWAEYLIILSSGIFVPEEIISLAQSFSWAKVGIIVVNAIILAYVIRVVVLKHRSGHLLRNHKPPEHDAL